MPDADDTPKPTNDRDQPQQAGAEETSAERGTDPGGGDEEDQGSKDKPSPLANPRVRLALIVGAILAAALLTWWFIHYRSYGRFPQVRAQVGEARGRLDQSRAAYRSAVLQALFDAESALSRFGHDRDNVDSLAEARASAARTAAKTDLRHQGGTATLLDALDAERQRLSAESNLAQAQAMLTSDWIGLQTSLGLGWSSVTRSDRPGSQR